MLSLGKHCELDMNTYEQIKSIVPHQVVVYAGVAVLMLMTLVFCGLIGEGLLTRREKNLVLWMPKICAAIITLISIVWIYFNDTVPHSDQAIILEEARKLAGYSSETYDWSYMSSFNFMRLLVIFMALLLKIFGDSQMVFRWFNIIAILMLVIGMQRLTDYLCAGNENDSEQAKLNKNTSFSKLVISIVLMFFYPIIIYTCYVYGTLAAVTFQVWAFNFAILFLREILAASDEANEHTNEKSIVHNIKKTHVRHSIGYGIGSILCIFLGIQMHMSALIGMVAICIFLLLRCKKNGWYKNIVLVIAMVVFYLVGNWGVNESYVKITNSPHQDAIPISAKVYMGLTAPETQPGGPGSQDGSYWSMFELNDCDAAKTNEYLWPIIGDVVEEYLTGERPLTFFVKKIEYQWLDPSLDAHRIILLNNPENGEGTNSPAYTDFYYSGLRRIALKLATAFMILVYGMSCFAGVCQLLGLENRISARTESGTDTANKEYINIHFLVQIFVIGGFAFQLIAESISRYVFSYYVLLLIEMVYGIYLLSEILKWKLNWKILRNT